MMDIDYKKLDLDKMAEEFISRGNKMGKMSFPQFFMTIISTPMTSIELLIKNHKNEFLLTYRDDSDFHGWHFPGSIIRKNESFEYCCRRIAKEEVGVNIENFHLGIGINNLNNPDSIKRHYKGKAYETHFIGIACMADLVKGQTPKDGKFFYNIPEELIDAHKLLFEIGKSYLNTGEKVLVKEEIKGTEV